MILCSILYRDLDCQDPFGRIADNSEATRVRSQSRNTTPESIAAYLEAVFEDGDPALIAAAVGDITCAMGMTQLAEKAGVTREALYKALSPTGDPRLSTFLGVMKALGIKLTPHAA